MSDPQQFHGTTIVSARRGTRVAMGGDGQVTLGNIVIKATARKVRRIHHDKILAGFAGATADAFTLFERFEAKLDKHQGNLMRSAIELAFQARCLAEAKAEGLPATQVAVEGFPSLGRLPDWKAKKVHTFAAGMSLEKIRSLVEQANRLQTIMYPTGEEDYVPDWEEYIETLTLQLTMR